MIAKFIKHLKYITAHTFEILTKRLKIPKT